MSDPIRLRRDLRTRQEVRAAALEALAWIDRVVARRPELAGALRPWRERLAAVPAALDARGARVAVVGAVKSGKSTLVNALLGEDLLPRGSGILTAQVTEVVKAPGPWLEVTWRSRAEVNRLFRFHAAALGVREQWDLWRPEHREAAARLLRRVPPSPHAEPLRALLEGFGAVAHRVGEAPRSERVVGAPDLWSWATREYTAVYLAGLRAAVPAPGVPEGLHLLDCPGCDAWNAAHGSALDEAVLGAHALVYVVSGRVGLREADVRFLGALREYGLLELTRFVLNVDLGEIRTAADLERVRARTESDLGRAGVPGRPVLVSALLSLLDARVLVSPGAVAPGERRLREAWESAAGGLASELRDAFETFRSDLWEAAGREWGRLVTARARADLRRAVAGAGRVLAREGMPSQAGRSAQRADTADALLEWLRRRMDQEAHRVRGDLEAAFHRSFRSRWAPQRRAWARGIEGVDPADPDGWRRVEAVLAATEPLRVNAVRNLALEARGELARAGEALAREAAEALTHAGDGPGNPPDRVLLSRAIASTRRIPLFRARWAAGTLAPGGSGPSWLRMGRVLAGRRGGQAGRTARRAWLRMHLARAWAAYLEAVLGECLLPHVEEAAAEVYDSLALWMLDAIRKTGTRGRGL